MISLYVTCAPICNFRENKLLLLLWTSSTQEVLWCCKVSPGASELMQNKVNSSVTTIMLHHLDSLCHFDRWYLLVSSYHKMIYGGPNRIPHEWTFGKPLNSPKTLHSLFTEDNSSQGKTHTLPPPPPPSTSPPTPTSALTRANSSLSWLTSCMSCSMIRSRSSGCGGDGMPFWPNGSPNRSWEIKQQQRF